MTETGRTTAREWLLRLGLLAASLLMSLGLAELVLALFFPLYGGRDNVTLDGKPLTEWFPPGTVYRQISNEYDARTTITEKGHRVPGTTGVPDVVFLGDSFTYGFGLDDAETFASIYCEAMKVSCANLGIPGSGTSKQVARLEQFLTTWQWRPREVKLFFFGMSTAFSNGNDFADNYNYGRRMATGDGTLVAADESDQPGLARGVIDAQGFLLEHSNLVRRAKFHWGPLIKSLIVDDFGERRMQEALRYTRQGLVAFDSLSRQFGFTYRIYLIVPVQDIRRGTYGATLAALNSVSPTPVIPTAELFLEKPESFYYAYDGHLNAAGSRRIAELLVTSDRTAPASSQALDRIP